MKTLKSIGAVLTGILVNVILSTGTDFILETLGIFPSFGGGLSITWMLIVALSYRLVYTVAGGYVTAMLAPDHPMRHVKILGVIGIVLSTVGVVVGWNHSEHWYPIALVITAYPSTWLGGKLKMNSSTVKISH